MTTPEHYDDGPGARYTDSLRHHDSMDRGHLLAHLRRSVELVEAMTEGEGDGCAFAVPHYEKHLAVELMFLLRDISHHVPHVEAWVAGYFWDTGGDRLHWSGFYGCESKRQAEAIARYAKKKEEAKNPHRRASGWQARWTDVGVHSLVRPEAKPEDVTRGLYT